MLGTRGRRGSRHRPRDRFRGLLDNQMHIGTAHAKGTDPCYFERGVPGREFCGYADGPIRPGNARIGFGEVQMRRHGAVLQRQHHLHQPGHPGGGIQMPHIGFDRADVQRLSTILAQDSSQSHHFNGITQRRAGAVRFDIADLMRLDPSMVKGLLQHRSLSRPAGGGDRAAMAIVIDSGAADERQNPVAVTAGVGEAFERDHPTALALSKTIRLGIKRFAASIGG